MDLLTLYITGIFASFILIVIYNRSGIHKYTTIGVCPPAAVYVLTFISWYGMILFLLIVIIDVFWDKFKQSPLNNILSKLNKFITGVE